MTEKEKNNNPFKNNSEEEITLENQNEEIKENTKEEPSTETDLFQEKYNELNNQYLRLAADFDNYRKRQAQEREALLRYGAENALTKLLEVLDNFERGEKALESVDDCQKCKESFAMIHKQVVDILTKLGLEAINAQGQEFDPNFHEAVMQTPTSEHPENTIIAELQKGYKMGDKVLRPTLVNVATEA